MSYLATTSGYRSPCSGIAVVIPAECRSPSFRNAGRHHNGIVVAIDRNTHSILLGFVFAGYVVVLSRNITGFLVLVGFLSTFYADTLMTLYVRKRDGERLSQAHRRHLYQLLANQKQVAHWKVSVCYGILQVLVGVGLLMLYPFGWQAVLLFEGVLLVIWCLVMQRVRSNVEISVQRPG